MHDGPNTKDVLVAQRYRLREAIEAGTDTVRRAVDETVGRTVVLEKLPLDVLPQTRIAATVHHPHLVSILDVVEEPDALWLVREDPEPAATRSLAQLVGDHGPMALPAAALVGAQVAAGLAAGHAAGVAHGALTPDRILVTDTRTGPVAKISGLGSSSVTDAGTDVRSFGAALSVAVGGNAVEPMATLIRQLTDDDPAARPTAAQAQVELARIAAGAAGPARMEPLPPPRGRLRFAVAAAAAGVVVIAVVLAVAMLATSASPALTPTASVPPVVPADERALDPCSLVDVAALAPVGHATIRPGYGVFPACTAVIPVADVDVHVDVELLNDPVIADQVDIGLRNPIAPRIVPGPQEDGYCRRFVLLPGTHVVEVSAVRYGDGLTDRTDYCSVADIATEAAVARFVDGGIARRGSDADRFALAGISACDLLSRSSVTAAATAAGGEQADEPVIGYAGWSCAWGAVWLDYIRESAPGSPEYYGVPVTIAGRPGMTRTDVGPGCRAYVPQRFFTAEDGAMRAEYVRVIVDGTADSATICRAAVDLAARVATRLPAFG